MNDENEKDTKSQEDNATYNINADSITAGAMSVGSGSSATQINYGSGTVDERMKTLIEQLNTALATVPKERQEDAEAVSALTEDLIKSSEADKPNHKLLEIKGESLKSAAKALADVTPTVLAIATQIITHILKLPG